MHDTVSHGVVLLFCATLGKLGFATGVVWGGGLAEMLIGFSYKHGWSQVLEVDFILVK